MRSGVTVPGFGDPLGEWPSWCGAGDAAMGPMGVVVRLVFAYALHQMGLVPDHVITVATAFGRRLIHRRRSWPVSGSGAVRAPWAVRVLGWRGELRGCGRSA